MRHNDMLFVYCKAILMVALGISGDFIIKIDLQR